MLTYLVCLLLVRASVSISISKNHILDIDDNTLKNVRFIGDPDLVLNLSGRNLQAIEKDALDNVTDVISLDLSNNSLTILPQFIFSNLTKLETLSLANNKIQQLENLFTSLRYLKLLDISRNPIKELTRGSLFGLPMSARILIDGNNFWSISTDVCSNEKLETEMLETELEPEIYEIEDEIDKMSRDINIYRALKTTQLKLCKSDGIVTSLETFWRIGNFEKGCVEVPIVFSKRRVDLRNQDITGFQENWYRLYNVPIISVDLSNNRIAEMKEERLGYPSADLKYVNNLRNRASRILSDMTENDHLRQFNFKNNSVEDIKNNALTMASLYDLSLNENQLTSLNFVSTLPDTMIKFSARGNRITSIPNNVFSKLPHLSYLNLQANKIETLQNGVFQNLTSLRTLMLANNVITTIEQAAFKGLTALKMLDLQNNFIRDFQASTFAKLTSLETLNLNMNKIVNVTFIDLPRNLDTLYLESNEISVLERGSFVGVPRITLALSSNRISRIARGAFYIPTLEELLLGMNKLTTFESNMYEGLDRLRYLWLTANQITEIRKGSCENLGSLYLLCISYNPLQKLEAGALYGLSTDAKRDLYIQGNHLKEIQVGLFSDK